MLAKVNTVWLPAFRKNFFFLLFFCASPFLHAQSFDLISYGVEDGLSQSEVRCVFQDNRGYLWMGTAGGGVCSFDGIQFHEYGKKDGLAGQVIACIAQDSSGNMWFGSTVGGVSVFDGKSFRTIDFKSGLGSNDIHSIIAKKGAVWIGTSYGIYEYNEKTKAIRSVLPAYGLNAMCTDEHGTTWVGTLNGLFRFKDGKKDSIVLPFSASKERSVWSITSNGHGLIYIGMNDGLLIYRSATGTFLENKLTAALTGKLVRNVYIDHLQSVWAATMNNLIACYSSKGELTFFDKSNGMTAEAVFAITEDDTRHMWFGTREQSLLKLRSGSFTYYGNLPGMGSGTVFRIMEDHAHSMWIGSNEEGLYCYNGQVSKPVLNNGQMFRQPVATVEDQQQRIWVGHEDGLTCLVNERPVKQLLKGIRVRALMCDSKGNLWIGTWGKGVFRYDGKTVEHFDASQGGQLPGNFVHALCEDRKGNIWIGTGSGLVKYANGVFKTYGLNDGICNPYIGSLCEDQYGNIWFHTDACVMRFNGTAFTAYTDQDGLASNTFYCIAFDNAGQLWVGTNKGIDRVRLDAKGNVLAVKNYSRNEGFRGIECNSRAVCLASDGCLWFGTVKGVIRYNPLKDSSDNIEPKTHITGIRLFLEQTDWGYSGVEEDGWFHTPKQLELDYEHNHLTFLYQAIHLQSPQSTHYKFMLVGFDSTWQPVTTETQSTYTNLPPGKYVFKVIASNSEGKWNAKPAESGPIIILPPPPPFWRSWWFILLSFLFVGSVLFYTVIDRTRRIVQQKSELEKEVRERTIEISRQNEEKTVMLKEIHHRVKNNLQVISSLLNLQADGISDKRVLSLFEDCRHRVNSMALIHEKMYQSKNLVNIDIRNYIDELIRSLIDAYDTSKTVHLHADIEEHPFRIDTIVPMGLILNEIISNAMKYAFEDQGEGELYISLHKIAEHRFVLEVGDNGKGLPAHLNFESAETLGMQLIQMLSGQINGKVTLNREKGTHYRIEFVEEVKDRF